MENEKNIRYIAKHYHKGLFDTRAALKRVKPTSLFKARIRIAAIAGAVVVLGATASIFISRHHIFRENTPIENNRTIICAPEKVNRVIDFENATLPEVIGRIKEVYGIDVIDLPEQASTYTLSLHYEGNAEDLIETINDTLDTHMRISK